MDVYYLDENINHEKSWVDKGLFYKFEREQKSYKVNQKQHSLLPLGGKWKVCPEINPAKLISNRNVNI